MIYDTTNLFFNILLSTLFILGTIFLVLGGIYLFFYQFLTRILVSIYYYFDKVKEIDTQ